MDAHTRIGALKTPDPTSVHDRKYELSHAKAQQYKNERRVNNQCGPKTEKSWTIAFLVRHPEIN